MAPCRSKVMTHPFITHMNGFSLTRNRTSSHMGTEPICERACANVSLHVTWQLKDIDCELMCWQGVHMASFADHNVNLMHALVHCVCMCVRMSVCHDGRCFLCVGLKGPLHTCSPCSSEPETYSRRTCPCVLPCGHLLTLKWFEIEKERTKQRESAVFHSKVP